MPMWVSDDGEEMVAVGSIAELKELSGVEVGWWRRRYLSGPWSGVIILVFKGVPRDTLLLVAASRNTAVLCLFLSVVSNMPVLLKQYRYTLLQSKSKRHGKAFDASEAYPFMLEGFGGGSGEGT